MSPVWIAIGGLSVAVVGLLVTLMTHLIKHSYSMGVRDQRIAALEARPHDSDCATQLASLAATLQGFKETTAQRMDSVDSAIHSLRNVLMGQQSKPTRARSA